LRKYEEFKSDERNKKYNHREIEFIEAGNICIRLKEEEHEA
jgi:hypothetical protein